MNMRRVEQARAMTWIAAVLIAVTTGAAGCSSSTNDKTGQQGGKGMDNDALAALKRAEGSGKLDGFEIEHYVSGGLPPPHYRSDQFRLFTDHGRSTAEFVTPDYSAKVKQGEAYPRHVYKLPASPSDVQTFARLVREAGAFGPTPPAQGAKVADRVKTEIVVTLGDKEIKHVYPGAEPTELTKLREFVNPFIARLKAQGEHKIEK
jgi:hypothetical protein